jgi:ubiquinone/menaquinone biosynthesis C-methylase UbiE
MKRYRAFAQYYDAEYGHAEMLHQEVPFFLGHLPQRRQKILELAVGTGRAAIPLAQAGHRIVGVDYADDMLELAREKCQAVGVRERDLKLVQQDALKLDLRETFDWICIFFNTLLNFTTTEEFDALFAGVKRHLKPRGRFWIDIFNPDLHRLARDHEEHIEPGMFYVPSLDRTVSRDTEIVREPIAQVQHITYHYRWFDHNGEEQHEKLQFDLTYLFPRELQLLLERNGLTVDRFYGNYDGSALKSESPRIIAIVKHLPDKAKRRVAR